MAGIIEDRDIRPDAAAPVSTPADPMAAYPDRVYNFIICILDWIGASVGLAFLSTATIFPVFLKHLGASNLVIGSLPALINLAFQLPGILVARHITKMVRVRGFVFRNAIVERLLLFPIGLLAPIWAVTHPKWMIGVVFFCMIGFAIIVGFNQPPYWTMFAKCIPTTWRGRLIGLSGLITGLAGLGISHGLSHMLSGPSHGFPDGFGRCFLIGAAITFSTVFCLGIYREPASEPHADPEALDIHPLARCAQIWRDSPSFRRFLLAQAAVAVATMAVPFYVLQAQTKLHAPNSFIAIYTGTLMMGTAVGGLVFGLLADRVGNKIIYVLSAVCLLLAASSALFIHSPWLFALVFAVGALSDAAGQIAVSNLTLEIAPADRDIPFYTAFANCSAALPRLLAPLAGGLIADHFGYDRTFIAAAVFAAIAVVFTLKITEPRIVHNHGEAVACTHA